MNINKKDNTPGSPSEWYELGVSLRQRERFGEAINAFRKAEETAAALIERLSSGQSADGSELQMDLKHPPLQSAPESIP